MYVVAYLAHELFLQSNAKQALREGPDGPRRRPCLAHDPRLTNDILAAKLLEDPALLRRNGVTLDWDGAWTLQKPPVDVAQAGVIDTSVRFVQRIPIRLTTLLSVGLDVSRSEVRRLIAAGSLSSTHRLTGTVSGDFSFTLRRHADNQRGH